MIKFNTILNTNGRGYWSNKARAVSVTKLSMPYVNDEGDFGELRVYFNTDTWDTDTDGLIYTDKQFMTELRSALTVAGFNARDIGYSEQGMQGDNYVSLDVDEGFINSWTNIVGINA
jgi:hypothetical protein